VSNSKGDVVMLRIPDKKLCIAIILLSMFLVIEIIFVTKQSSARHEFVENCIEKKIKAGEVDERIFIGNGPYGAAQYGSSIRQKCIRQY